MVWVTFLRYGKKAPEGFFHYFSLTTAPVAVDVTFRLIKRLSFTLSSSISVTLWFCYSVNMSVVVATRPVVMNDFYQVTNPNSQSLFEGQAEISRDHLCKMLWVVVTVIVLCLGVEFGCWDKMSVQGLWVSDLQFIYSFQNLPLLGDTGMIDSVAFVKVMLIFCIVFVLNFFQHNKYEYIYCMLVMIWWYEVTWHVTHTRNLCSAFNPHTVHTQDTQQWTHTHREHTPGAVGSHLCCGARGAVGGLVPCSRAPQSWYWGWRERWLFTPPPTIPAGPRLEHAAFRLQVRLSNH